MTGPSYAGDIDVQAAWERLSTDPASVLVDVRTRAEWTFVGIPDLSGIAKQVALVEWQGFPDMAFNPGFAAQVEAAGVPKDAAVFLICRSGQRSRDAAVALTDQGYRQCFNVAGGFEGPKDASGHRGGQDGWKAAGLPWLQN